MTELWIIKILLCIMYTLAAADSCRNKKVRTCETAAWHHHCDLVNSFKVIIRKSFRFFFGLITCGLLRFITIIAREHLLNVKRFLGIFTCFDKAKLDHLHSFWEFSLMEYSPISTDSGYFMILILSFDHALKQKQNCERCSNIFVLQTNLPLSKMINFCFLEFLIYFILWVRTKLKSAGIAEAEQLSGA